MKEAHQQEIPTVQVEGIPTQEENNYIDETG
jgi:hypothetical protein